MSTPSTPAGQVVAFARTVLAIELEAWQASALEQAVTSYGTACVMTSSDREALKVPTGATTDQSSVASTGEGAWVPQHPTGQVPGAPAGVTYRGAQTTQLAPDPGGLPWPHDGKTIGDQPEAGSHQLRDRPLGADDRG